MIRRLCLLIFCTLAVGCANFEIGDLAKSDTDLATDQHIQQMNAYMKSLATKLYKRNPIELTKAPGETPPTMEERIDLIFNTKGRLQFEELLNLEEIDAMNLAFREEYTGDRVFALMVGLVGMMRHSYDYKEEFYFTDSLDPNKLYTSARNIEIMSWQLKARRKSNGDPFLITSHTNGTIDNTSFERLYGKMIGQQDILAKVIADRDSRSINFLVHSSASMVFLPF